METQMIVERREKKRLLNHIRSQAGAIGVFRGDLHDDFSFQLFGVFGDDLFQALFLVAQIGFVFVGRRAILQEEKHFQVRFVRLPVLLIVLDRQDSRSNA